MKTKADKTIERLQSVGRLIDYELGREVDDPNDVDGFTLSCVKASLIEMSRKEQEALLSTLFGCAVFHERRLRDAKTKKDREICGVAIEYLRIIISYLTDDNFRKMLEATAKPKKEGGMA